VVRKEGEDPEGEKFDPGRSYYLKPVRVNPEDEDRGDRLIGAGWIAVTAMVVGCLGVLALCVLLWRVFSK